MAEQRQHATRTAAEEEGGEGGHKSKKEREDRRAQRAIQKQRPKITRRVRDGAVDNKGRPRQGEGAAASSALDALSLAHVCVVMQPSPRPLRPLRLSPWGVSCEGPERE